jgi:hypothetical protein
MTVFYILALFALFYGILQTRNRRKIRGLKSQVEGLKARHLRLQEAYWRQVNEAFDSEPEAHRDERR